MSSQNPLLLFLIGIAVTHVPAAPEARITVHASQVRNPISRFLTGACLEDVNHECYGGLYSQMIFGEAFQEPAAARATAPAPRRATMSAGSGAPGMTPPHQNRQAQNAVSGMWRAVHRGSACGQYALETAAPFLGRQSQRMTFVSGAGEVGIENEGLNRWGMSFRQGRLYDGEVWARADRPTWLRVAIENRQGSTLYAERRLRVRDGGWQRLNFKLRPTRADTHGRFVIALAQPGSVVLGYAFVEPGRWGRFRGLPVRKDLAEALIRQGLTVLRYGGSMVNAPGYRWKKMIGPRDRRPPYQGTWYPYASNGWGIIDFLDFCEHAGFLGVPAFNLDETPADMADFIEYVNGPPTSPWGRRRVADGHPHPYRLRYLELGNEEAVNTAYFRHFKPIMAAVWAKDPAIIPVVGDFSYSQPIRDPYDFKGAPRIHTLAAHRRILEFAARSGHEVWFDVHIGTDSPRDWQGLGGVPSFTAALGKIAPGSKYKVVVFEFNAGHHNLGRALGNARAINELERAGGRIAIACSANCLQPDGQNDNGWDQGLVFFNPSKVWAQPPYYVTQMDSRNYLPLRVAAQVTSPDNALDATATRSVDGQTLVLTVVNLENQTLPTQIALDGFHGLKPEAQVLELEGPLDAANTVDAPRRIAPRRYRWRHRFRRASGIYAFPPNSFTLLRFNR